MKKLFIAALIAATFVTSAFAKDVNKISSAVLRQFNTEFKGASNVVWSSTRDYTKAAFTVNDQKMEAFFNSNGDVIATTTTITADQLPAAAKRSFAKRFDGYDVKDIIRFEGADEDGYYISASNEKEAVIVKITDDNTVSTFQKTKK